MVLIRAESSVKLITGLIFKEDCYLNKAKTMLVKLFGGIDLESLSLTFNHTNYYEKEFGSDLKRVFISFKKLIKADELPDIKIMTNRIEKKISQGDYRLINIDPGYLNHSKLILASTKDFKHRIYLNKGIFAEITLFYQDKTFQPWEWTYPDYRTQEYINIFNHIREIYDTQIAKKHK